MRSCRWWPEGAGDDSLCAKTVNEDAAYQRLRGTYPLLSVAVWLAVASLFLQTLRLPKSPGVRMSVTALVTVLTVAAVVGLLSGVDGAQSLAGEPLSLGALGFYLALIGAVCAGLSAFFQER